MSTLGPTNGFVFPRVYLGTGDTGLRFIDSTVDRIAPYNPSTGAQPERTFTHTHDTAEETPEGSVERTRKGIRYPQLLSFVGAATEQRLASIEARLDAANL